MRVVGLTGGIGAGKSTAAEMLAALGAVVIDADLVARQVVMPGGPVHDAVLARFGTLDRARLAEVVFADPASLADLNAIVHPAVRTVIAERLEGLSTTDDVVVLGIPLLVESASPYPIDVLVVVDCPEEVAVARLVRDRAMDESDARRRMAFQADRPSRLAAADVVIVNVGSREDLEAEIRKWWPVIAGNAPPATMATE